MRKLNLLAACLILAACGSTKPTRIPDTGDVSNHVGKIGNAATSAQQSADRVDNHIHGARTDAQRIDDKAVVVLRWLRK